MPTITQPTIIQSGHPLYCEADESLRRIIELAGDPPQTITRKRYQVEVEQDLEQRFQDVLKKFHERYDGKYGIMLVLGYHPLLDDLFEIDFKKDLIAGTVNLRDDYRTIENAILRVADDETHHDCCYVIDGKGGIYSGYKVDLSVKGILRAFNTNTNQIRLELFGDPYTGGTRFEYGIAVAHLIVGSTIGMIREQNGVYIVKNRDGLINIPYSDGKDPQPIKGTVLNTNIGVANKSFSQKILVA